MPFINEYIPSAENETSLFAAEAKAKLNTGHSKHDKWTIDRDRRMVLQRTGCGHTPEGANTDFWKFLEVDGIYTFSTDLINSTPESEGKLNIERTINFPDTPGFNQPGQKTVSHIKEALQTYKDYGVISDFSDCALTLIEAISGKAL